MDNCFLVIRFFFKGKDGHLRNIVELPKSIIRLTKIFGFGFRDDGTEEFSGGGLRWRERIENIIKLKLVGLDIGVSFGEDGEGRLKGVGIDTGQILGYCFDTSSYWEI